MEARARAICQKENIEAETLEPLSGGQVNGVFLVNQRYVVRIGSGQEASRRLQSEASLLREIAGEIPVPEVYAFGQHQGSTYQIQRFVRGEKLHHIWGDLSPECKDRIISELASYLRTLHQHTAPRFGYPHEGADTYGSWPEFCEHRLRIELQAVEALGIGIPSEILRLITGYFHSHKHALQGGIPSLVHRDLWPGNILVEKGRISAILDFEFAMYAPRDYELLLIERFCLYPNDYAEEDNEIYDTSSFSDLFCLLRKHYPEIFEVRSLRERLNLYHLLYSLEAHVAWRRTQGGTVGGDLPIQPIATALNFVFDHGARMF